MVTFKTGDRVRVLDATHTHPDSGVEVGDTGFIEELDWMGLGLGIIVVHFDNRTNFEGQPLHQGFYSEMLELIGTEPAVEAALTPAGAVSDSDILKRVAAAANHSDEVGLPNLAVAFDNIGAAAIMDQRVIQVLRTLVDA